MVPVFMMGTAFAMMASHAVLLSVGLVLLELLWRHDLLEIRLIVFSHVGVLLIEVEQLSSLFLVEIIALHRHLGLHLHEILLVELLVAVFLVATLLFTALELLALLLTTLTLFFVLLCESC